MAKPIPLKKVPLFKVINHKRYYYHGSNWTKSNSRCIKDIKIILRKKPGYAHYKLDKCYE